MEYIYGIHCIYYQYKILRIVISNSPAHLYCEPPLVHKIPFIGAWWGLDMNVCAVYGTNHIREAWGTIDSYLLVWSYSHDRH